jgi:hypothetical protein
LSNANADTITASELDQSQCSDESTQSRAVHDVCNATNAVLLKPEVIETSFTEQSGRTADPHLHLGEQSSGPLQPLSFTFPLTDCGKQKRGFVKDWFKKFPWIEYSVLTDAAYCFPCRHFSCRSGYSETLFTDTGFRDWKYATGKDGKLIKHEKSAVHIDAVQKWNHYRQVASGQSVSVMSMQLAAHKQWVSSNRFYLRRVTEAILYLSRQALAFRGHDESTASKNRGNFLELIDLMRSIDTSLQEHFDKMGDNSKYTIVLKSRMNF